MAASSPPLPSSRCTAKLSRILILIQYLLVFVLGPPYLDGALAVKPCPQCDPKFKLFVDHPVVLDGALVGFSVNVKAQRRANAAKLHHNQLPMDEFHVHEQVREFCWFNKMESTDCNVFLDSVQKKARKKWTEETSKCQCARGSPNPLPTHRLFSWRGTQRSDHQETEAQTIYLQVVSLRAAQTLLGVSLTWHQKLSVDDYGHSLGGFVFPKELSEPPYNHLLDSIVPEIFGGASSELKENPPRLVLVPPNAPGSLPWTPPPKNTLAVVIIFDSDSSTEHPRQFLERVMGCDKLLQHHRNTPHLTFGVGLVVLGDNAGIFPTSVYSSADWALRQYHFEDHMQTYNNDMHKVVPRWLPLGPMFQPQSRELDEEHKPILVLAVIDHQLSERSILCDRESAEQNHNDDKVGPNYSARCYSDWRRQGILEGMAYLKRKLHQPRFDSTMEKAGKVRVVFSPSQEDLQELVRNASFVVAPPEHLSIGSESRLLWTCLESGAIPIINGPTSNLGLPELGEDNPLPQLSSGDWKNGLIRIMSPLVRSMMGLASTGETRQGNVSNIFVSQAAAHRQIVRLRSRVQLWYTDMKASMLTRIIDDVKDVRRHIESGTRYTLSSRRKQPYEYLLQSYKAWDSYNALIQAKNYKDAEDFMEETYLAASSSLQLGLEPTLLRIFSHEQMACVEHRRSFQAKRKGVYGWQSHNRRALVAISEALRVVLGEWESARPLFPWLPKLLLSAGALAWDLSANRAGEALTLASIAFSPLSVNALEQLVGILTQLKRHDSAVMTRARRFDTKSDRNNERKMGSLLKYIDWLKQFTGYTCNANCKQDLEERWSRWPVLSERIAARWWRADEFRSRIQSQSADKHVIGLSQEIETPESNNMLGSGELTTESSSLDAVRLLDEMSESIIPVKAGERDAIDELLWLLDGEDTSPLMTLLESSPFRGLL